MKGTAGLFWAILHESFQLLQRVCNKNEVVEKVNWFEMLDRAL